MHRPTSVHLAYVSSLYATLSVEKSEQHGTGGKEPGHCEGMQIASAVYWPTLPYRP